MGYERINMGKYLLQHSFMEILVTPAGRGQAIGDSFNDLTALIAYFLHEGVFAGIFSGLGICRVS